MRVAQLAGWYSPTSGGIRTVVHRLADGYAAAGHSSVLVVPGPHDTVGPDRITLSGPVLPGSGGYRVVIRPGVLGTALERAEPDVVELHDKAWLPSVRRWADRRGVPVVLVSHERLDRTLPMLLPWLPRTVTLLAAERVRCMVQRKADVVVACSGFAGAEFPGARRVPLGVDLDAFSPAPAEPRTGVGLVLASRLAREKRPDVAVDTVAALRRRGIDARLTVYGSGPLLPALRERAAGLPVEFAGFTADRPTFARALATADVVLAPGPAETFGLSALEALASGTPVVAAEGAAVAELLRDTGGTGIAGRAAALDGEAFATAVTQVLDGPEQPRRLAARALAERYPWSRTVEAMLALHTATIIVQPPVAV